MIAHQIAPFPIASRPLQKLSSSDVETWHGQLRTEGRRNGKGGVSIRTIHHAHKLLAKSLREAVRHGLVLRNVATEQRPPKLNAAPMVILTPEQVKELPAKLKGRPIYAPAMLLHTHRHASWRAIGAALVRYRPGSQGDRSAPRSNRRPSLASASKRRRPKAACARSFSPRTPSPPFTTTAVSNSSCGSPLGLAKPQTTRSCSPPPARTAYGYRIPSPPLGAMSTSASPSTHCGTRTPRC